MTQYAGANAFPTDFTIPDDAAPPTASNLLVAIEALGDRTVWLKNRLSDFFLVVEGLTTTTDGNPVQIGASQVTFTASSYSGDPTALPLASLPAVAGDVFEFEISGSVEGYGIFSAATVKVIVDDGSVLDVPHAQANWAQLVQPLQVVTYVDDPAGGSGVNPGTLRATYTGTTYGTPWALHTVSGLLAGDVVDCEVRASALYDGTYLGAWHIETKENAGSYVAEPAARYQVPNPSGLATQGIDTGSARTRHTMAANGTLAIALNGEISTGGEHLYVYTPIRSSVVVYRNGIRITPFAIVGRYTVTSTGTLEVGLDGVLVDAGTGIHLDAVGALACKWRLMRSAA
jgi:hypothetical protein